ncbi:MAG: hypothetical protein BWK75_01990 [Candidatus Altiarchaeales archaeon A3]|nr:MAG: hypothetical protein BWK75_01990 [Candidatus Altiarchaeales archaeon A3]
MYDGRNNLRFAIVGTHGIGKTTAMYDVAAKLCKKGIKVVTIPETARNCPFPINEKTTRTTQEWIFLTQMRWEIEANGRNENSVILGDRSAMDNWIYFKHAFGNDDMDIMQDMLQKYLKRYDCLFFMRIKKEEYLVNDGVRSTSLPFQQIIDVLIEKYLIKFGVKYIEIKNTDEIYDYILAHIEEQRIQGLQRLLEE